MRPLHRVHHEKVHFTGFSGQNLNRLTFLTGWCCRLIRLCLWNSWRVDTEIKDWAAVFTPHTKFKLSLSLASVSLSHSYTHKHTKHPDYVHTITGSWFFAMQKTMRHINSDHKLIYKFTKFSSVQLIEKRRWHWPYSGNFDCQCLCYCCWDPQMKTFILGISTGLFLNKHVSHLPQRKLWTELIPHNPPNLYT